MAMCETYPATWQEFIEEKYFRDHKEIYTNGAEIMLVSDVKKMMQHYSQERPKGRWIEEYKSYLDPHTGVGWDEVFSRCPICGRCERAKEPFCHCGADMRESEQE